MIVAIIQVRASSTRLPDKCFLKIEDKTILEHIVDRVKISKLINKVIIATTINQSDDEIVKLAKKNNIDYYRGSETDVLDRFYQAAKIYKANIICRITSDDPFKDPEIIDIAIKNLIEGNYDYVSNTIIPTYPEGIDIEVFTFKTLGKAWKESKKISEREHVTPYIYNNTDIFKILNFINDENISNLRWTLDYEKDWEFVKEVYKELYNPDKIFLMNDILDLLEKRPELSLINAGIIRNAGYLKSINND